MSRFQVPEVHLERLPHRQAVIRVRQAYGKLRQLATAAETTLSQGDKDKDMVQEVTK